MFLTEVLPGYVVIQEIAPAVRDLGSSCESLGIVYEGEHPQAQLIWKHIKGVLSQAGGDIARDKAELLTVT